MDENKRYKLFKFFLIFTMLNILGILIYEQVEWKSLLKKKPEFYVKSIKQETKKETKKDEREAKTDTEKEILIENKLSEIEEKKFLVLGDSNVFLMAQSRDEYEEKFGRKIYWLAESGVGTEFIDDEMKVRLGKVQEKYIINTLNKADEVDLVKNIAEKDITDVAIILGVNSLGESYAKELSNNLIKLSKKSKAQIFYISVLPYVDKAKYKLDNKDVVKFNNVMKKSLAGSDIKYIDGYSEISLIRGYETETTDGLHYSKAIYDKIMKKIVQNIMKNN